MHESGVGKGTAAGGVSRQVVPPHTYRRPDPMIYSQHYLRSLGFAVTWDNPDITLELNGDPVSSSALLPDTEYEVLARIWNGSLNAPAINLPVRFSYLSFGIGAQSFPIGSTTVTVPVKGADGLPAVAPMKWRTPKEEGHYCLQVELLPPDDANPMNNLGQENTNVKRLNSPHADFTFPVRNTAFDAGEVILEVDAYALPQAGVCRPTDVAPTPQVKAAESERRERAALDANGAAGFAVPPGWTVELQPSTMRLGPGAERLVKVDVTAPDQFTGRMAFNVNATLAGELLGGVTLYVEGA